MDTTGWDPTLNRDTLFRRLRAEGALARIEPRALVRSVQPPRSNRLALVAIRFAVAALMFWLGATCMGCTPTQRKATLAASSTTLLALDWHQTKWLVAHCDEQNPLLGDCGQHIGADVYFPVTIAANLALGYLLNDAYLGLVTGAELSTVTSNWMYEH